MVQPPVVPGLAIESSSTKMTNTSKNEVEIGNYPFIDFAVSIKVKKADIFVSYSNMFLLSGNYDAFIAPHYPMRGSKVFFGVNWRLFN